MRTSAATLAFTSISAAKMAVPHGRASPTHDHFAFQSSAGCIQVGTVEDQALLLQQELPKSKPKSVRTMRKPSLSAKPKPRSKPIPQRCINCCFQEDLPMPSYCTPYVGPPVPLEGDELIADLRAHIELLDAELDVYVRESLKDL